jgi:hypothetical protein
MDLTNAQTAIVAAAAMLLLASLVARLGVPSSVDLPAPQRVGQPAA